MKRIGILVLVVASLTSYVQAQIEIVKDILPGLESGIFRVYHDEPLDGKIIFTANAPDQNHRNFWVSDGTEDGTFIIQENIDEEGSSLAEPLAMERLGDKVIFPTSSLYNGCELLITVRFVSGTYML